MKQLNLNVWYTTTKLVESTILFLVVVYINFLYVCKSGIVYHYFCYCYSLKRVFFIYFIFLLSQTLFRDLLVPYWSYCIRYLWTLLTTFFVLNSVRPHQFRFEDDLSCVPSQYPFSSKSPRPLNKKFYFIWHLRILTEDWQFRSLKWHNVITCRTALTSIYLWNGE